MKNEQKQKACLRKNAIGTAGIIFFIIATNGPLTVLLGGTPAAIALGNGTGVPGTFILIGLVYLIFSVGLAAMARYVRNAGAFYTYISFGLGNRPGVSAAFLSIMAYGALNLLMYALFGYFCSQLIHSLTGHTIPWWICCLVCMAVVHYLSTKNIEFNGKMLTMLILAETIIIFLFDTGVAVKGGPEGFTLSPFTPSAVFGGGIGAAVVFITSCFIGFESAAIYSEEARDPHKTIPRALYISVIIIALLASVSTWLMMVAYGPDAAVIMAAKQPGELWLSMSAHVLGLWSVDVMNILMSTSLFAAILSLTNIVSRYLFALGREKMLWHRLAELHPTQQTPHVACSLQTYIMAVLITVPGIAGVEPLTVLMPLAAGVVSLSIVTVQCLTACAVIGFFGKDKRDTSLWQRLIAPAISAVLLFATLILILTKMDILTGGIALFDYAIPLAVLSTGLGGYFYAMWIRHKKPCVYAGLTRFLAEGQNP